MTHIENIGGAVAAATPAAPPKAPFKIGPFLERYLGLALLAVVGGWALYHLVTDPAGFAESALAGVKNGSLYALIALGYTIVYGIIELINFSHGDLFMLGSVFSATFVVTWFHQTDITAAAFGVMLVCLPAAMVACGGVNVLAERFAYRRLRKAPKLAPLITAVGLSFTYQWVGMTWNGSGQRSWPGLAQESFSVGGIAVSWATVLVLAVTIPLLLVLMFVVQRTRAGKAMRATAQDQDAARLMGIDVDRTIGFAFAIGGALAGAAGLLWLEAVGTTRYDLGFRMGLYAFTAAVLGGIGRLDGAVLGGFLIGLIENLNARYLLSSWPQTVIFSILILVMVFKPEGILGTRTTEKV